MSPLSLVGEFSQFFIGVLLGSGSGLDKAIQAIGENHLGGQELSVLLAELDRVEAIDLRGASVTDAGVDKLQKALPRLKIHR